MNKKVKVLIVDDEEDICEILRFNLKSEGYSVETAFSAENALEKIKENNYSLFILDVMMEGMSGFQMAEKLRDELESNIPIIFLTAKDTENDMLTGFSLGADDYISKPFSLKEVSARVKACLRRDTSKEEETETTSNIIEVDGLLINISNKIVCIDDKELQLTRKEFDILLLLVASPNKSFTRETILNTVWKNESIVLDRTVDVHITRLRKKIGKYSKRIVSRSNFGYSFKG